ncbi:PAS domain S-box protein [Candidatus Bipolaricaulota bacterium]|nr:PAS domain S-box protein [Candidatus Bipolaricaulota bacterium]
MGFSDHDCHNLIENLPEALFLEDLQGNILAVNSKACEILGYTREKLMGMSVEDIVPEGEPLFLPGRVDKAKRSDNPLESVTVRKDGTKVPVELKGKILEIGEGEKILVSLRDISKRKEKEESVQESEEKYRTIFESAGDAIFMMKNSTFVDCNRKTLELFGCDRDELVGNPPWKFSPEEQPDGRSSKEKAREKIQRALTGERQFFEWVHEKLDGTPIPTEVNLTSYEVDGEKFLMAIVRDVTERKETEKELKRANEKLEKSRERYRSYFEKLGDAIFITKAGGEDHGQIMEVNSTAIDQTGYSREELLGMNIEDDLAITPNRLVGYMDNYKTLDDEEMINFVERKRKKDGTEYWTEVVVTQIEYEGKNAALSINRDITERKRTQEALNEERNKLRSLHDAVDDIQRQDTEEGVARTAVKVAERMLDFEICDISVVEGEYIVTIASSAGIGQDQDTKFKITEGLAGKTFRTGETIWGDDISDNPDAKPIDGDFKAFISVPIGEIGVFQVISREEGSFDEGDVELAEILAGHLREELRRVRLEKQLRQQAIRDPLTDLYNRRYFNESLQKEAEKCKRYNTSLAFLMIDVNRFKEINDRYTHQIGDRVLKEVAELLQENVRSADTVVRYGGDEFLVMMPETYGEIENTEDRLKEELSRWNDRSDILDFPLTLAMGVAHWKPDRDKDVEEALKEADRRMYRDKEK